jgi:hypothetical protein
MKFEKFEISISCLKELLGFKELKLENNLFLKEKGIVELSARCYYYNCSDKLISNFLQDILVNRCKAKGKDAFDIKSIKNSENSMTCFVYYYDLKYASNKYLISFTEDFLLGDGYTKEQIENIYIIKGKGSKRKIKVRINYGYSEDENMSAQSHEISLAKKLEKATGMNINVNVY